MDGWLETYRGAVAPWECDVVEHFTDTAALLNRLTESYRDVHNHLASGAAALCDDDSASILPRLPDGSLSQLAQEPELDNIQPPLDYAPKSSPDAPGMLNEEFGLERVEPEEQPEKAPEPARP